MIPGDGIGREVVPEGVKVLEKIADRFGIAFAWNEFDWSCERFDKCGAMMPEEGIRQISGHDAIFLGAVGFPGVPDHVSLWGLLIPIRREFRQYINLRPVRLFQGVPCPLAGRMPGDIDFYIVRENNEGEYSEIGGRLYAGTEHETVVQESVFTRQGVDRVLRYAFELAHSRDARHLTSATKSNGIIHTMVSFTGLQNSLVDTGNIDLAGTERVRIGHLRGEALDPQVTGQEHRGDPRAVEQVRHVVGDVPGRGQVHGHALHRALSGVHEDEA